VHLHTGQRSRQAAYEGLIHDRTRSRDQNAQKPLARTGASIHGNRFFASNALYNFGIDHVICVQAIPPKRSVI
jgi:hypothetical protein